MACGASSQDSLARAIAALDRAYLTRARWFADKERRVHSLELVDRVVPRGAEGGMVALVAVAFADGGAESYALPVRVDGDSVRECGADDPLWPALARRAAIDPGSVPESPARFPSDDQSHTSVVLGESVVLKLYRRLAAGPFPEAEALEALNGLGCVPRFRGALAHGEGSESTPLAVLQEYVPAVEAGWEPLIERVAAVSDTDRASSLAPVSDTGTASLLAPVSDTTAALLADASRLGAVAAEIHVRLS